eukprot:Gb_34604 [translate_table: standard]
MAGGGQFENMPCRALSSKLVAGRSLVHLVAYPHISSAPSPRCPIVAVARLDWSACRAVGIIENMPGCALSSKLVAVRSLVVVSFSTDFRFDSAHLVSLVAHLHFSPAPSPCCPIVAVACLDGSACWAVGIIDNMPGRALSSKRVDVRSSAVVSLGTGFHFDSVHLVPLSAHPRFFTSPSLRCRVVAVARWDVSACRAVGYSRICPDVRSLPSLQPLDPPLSVVFAPVLLVFVALLAHPVILVCC